MARGGGGDIPGNNLGQGFTSPSTFTHVPGAYGALLRVARFVSMGHAEVFSARAHFRTAWSCVFKLNSNTQCHPLSVAIDN